jgi:lysozyme
MNVLSTTRQTPSVTPAPSSIIVPPATLPLVHGIDISQFQQAIDWQKVRASGKVQFVYARATEGLGFIDGSYRTFHDGAKAANIPFGAYHFFSFRDTGISQAYDFLSTINGYAGQLIPMLDLEELSLHGLDISLIHISDFLVTVQRVMKIPYMLIYTNLNFWNTALPNGAGGYDGFAGHPLWIAEYNSDPVPTLPNGFTKWAVWQYTDLMVIPGITTNNGLPEHVDGDVLFGSIQSIVRAGITLTPAQIILPATQ